jgi:hypothetical protein
MRSSLTYSMQLEKKFGSAGFRVLVIFLFFYFFILFFCILYFVLFGEGKDGHLQQKGERTPAHFLNSESHF